MAYDQEREQLIDGVAVELKTQIYQVGNTEKEGVAIDFQCCGCGLTHRQFIEASVPSIRVIFWETGGILMGKKGKDE